MLFDTHAHYDDEAFDPDRELLLESLPQRGVALVLNPGCDLDSSRKAVSYAAAYPHVYAAVGIHPENCAGFVPADIDVLRELARQPKVAAIGEIGLDYYWAENPPRELQQQVLRAQLALAGLQEVSADAAPLDAGGNPQVAAWVDVLEVLHHLVFVGADDHLAVGVGQDDHAAGVANLLENMLHDRPALLEQVAVALLFRFQGHAIHRLQARGGAVFTQPEAPAALPGADDQRVEQSLGGRALGKEQLPGLLQALAMGVDALNLSHLSSG